MHSETAIRATASKLLLEKEQLQALKEPFVGLAKFGGSGWKRVKVQPYFARVLVEEFFLKSYWVGLCKRGTSTLTLSTKVKRKAGDEPNRILGRNDEEGRKLSPVSSPRDASEHRGSKSEAPY
jgi:hypothetical protein